MSPSRTSTSLVWFTIGRGILQEIFQLRLDRACTRQLGLIVTDDHGFFSEEQWDTHHQYETLAQGVPAYRIINTCKEGRYRIEKTVLTNPYQEAVIQQTRFVPLQGRLEDYHLFAVLNPHLENQGSGNTAWIGQHKGAPTLFAQRNGMALALACSPVWLRSTAGYVGSRVGVLDLKEHGHLTHLYERAADGNVALIGEVNLSACDGAFLLALGFAPDAPEAAHRARSSLLADFEQIRAEYVQGWLDWQEELIPLERNDPGNRDLYRISTAVIRAHEGKTVPGALIASLSIPWGHARGDNHIGHGGYHLVWPRDQVAAAGALLAAGDREDPLRILQYLQATQEADGHWPQNMWVSSKPYWEGIQMGETALPVVLIELLQREGVLGTADLDRFWPMVRQAVGYLVRQGPSTQEDRWENERGFAPFTISASITALLIAAELAEGQRETDLAQFLRETADAWNASIEYWTYVEGTKLAEQVGVPGYYLRIAPPNDRGEPIKTEGRLQFWFRPESEARFSPADIVSVDALAYVRFGLRPADDPLILNTIRVIDAVLKVETPYGPCWHRYNNDGYGEKPDGSAFNFDKGGRGRAWPLLTGERAHYELAAGQRDEAVRLLRAMEGFAGEGGMISEQVWDTEDIPERSLFLGRPTGSAMPLVWAHAEYVKLRRSLRDNRVFDMPRVTSQRYQVDRVQSNLVLWRRTHQRSTLPAGRMLRVESNDPGTVLWSPEDDPKDRVIPLRDSGLGLYVADLGTGSLPRGTVIRFRFRPGNGRPEDTFYQVKVV